LEVGISLRMVVFPLSFRIPKKKVCQIYPRMKFLEQNLDPKLLANLLSFVQ
jgi:hypothetical protein